MNAYRLLNINDLPILQGTSPIKKVDKGYPDKIYSFGDGQCNGSYTTLRFSMPLTYAGETQSVYGHIESKSRYLYSEIVEVLTSWKQRSISCMNCTLTELR